MATTVKIEIPQVNNGILSANITATLKNSVAQTGTVKADLRNLIPWINKASVETFDFLLLSFFVYGIDRFLQRKANSVDGWSREVTVNIPVVKLTTWRAQKQQVENLLSFLTGDYWTVTFYKNTMSSLPAENLDSKFQMPLSQVTLFSGGMDSLIGAIDLLETSKSAALFVSHYDRNMRGPKGDQETLIPLLENQYPNRFIYIPAIDVYLDNVSSRETTCRSRSIVFIGIANLFANVLKKDICVPENGTVSVNYPLSPSRRCACSTRTTHPSFIDELAGLFTSLGIQSKIFNPYRFYTKGEMADKCKNTPFFQTILSHSNSCGKRGHRRHWDGSGTHCGVCMPCIYRRAALLNIKDLTAYGNDINKLNFKTKKGQDVGTMLDFLNETISDREIKFELISNGLKDQPNLYHYINLISRTRIELTAWVAKYGTFAVKNKAGI